MTMCVCNICRLRDTCEKVAQRQFSDQWKQGRVECIPVEWRTGLHLDNGTLFSLDLYLIVVV